MTVVNPKSISGINSITMASGSDDLLTIHSNNTTERVRVNNSGDVIVGSGVTLSPDGDVFATGVCTATSFVGSGANLTGVASTENIRTNTNATFLQNINVSGTTTAAGNINVSGANITLQDSGGSSDDRLVFGAGSDLSIYHDGNNSFIKETGTGRLTIATSQLQLTNGADSAVMIKATESDAVELYHNGTKQCETSANGLAFPSGKGIDFSATSGSGTSELFDDYEEGNFTPTVNAIASPNYSVQVGRYTKIGNLVTAQAYLLLASGGGEGSVFSIGSLPFTSTNTTYKEGGGYIIYENGFFDNSSTVSAKNTCTVWVPANNTIIQFHKRYNGAAIWGNDTSFGLGSNNVYLIVQVCYTVA